MAKRKLLKILIDKADTIKDKIKKLIKGDPVAKYKNDPEYISLMRQLDNIDMKAKDASFELFGDMGADAQLNKILKEKTTRKSLRKQRLAEAKYQPKPLKKESGSYETMAQKKQKKPRAKGGMVKRPQMMQGGAYKGKKHSYAAGGKVNKLKF